MGQSDNPIKGMFKVVGKWCVPLAQLQNSHRSHPRLHELSRSTSALCRCFGLGLGLRFLLGWWVLSHK